MILLFNLSLIPSYIECYLIYSLPIILTAHFAYFIIAASSLFGVFDKEKVRSGIEINSFLSVFVQCYSMC